MEKKNAGFADLHVHTIYSDGTFPPETVVEKASEMGLRAIAITDHDCAEGIPPGIEAAKRTGLEIIPGIELSAAIHDTEIHILGYFIDWQDEFFADVLKKMKVNRIERMHGMVRLLHEHGLMVDEAKVMESVQVGTIGRLHLARIMVEDGVVSGLKGAFDNYIGDGKPCSVRHKRLDYKKAIDMIKNAGGVPVLAHPGAMGNDAYIPDYVRAGLRGIEVYHSDHRSSDGRRYLEMARENGLIVTGGSDCHGTKKREVLLGKIKVGYDVVESLRAEAEKIRKEK